MISFQVSHQDLLNLFTRKPKEKSPNTCSELFLLPLTSQTNAVKIPRKSIENTYRKV